MEGNEKVDKKVKSTGTGKVDGKRKKKRRN